MSYDISVQDEGDRRHIWIRGEIDEDFDATQLREVFTSNVVMHLEDVKSISSCGIREWISFVSELPSSTHLDFEKCSIPITRQFGMLSNFRGPGHVRSFYAPYFCEECDEETEHLLEVDPNGIEKKAALKASSTEQKACAGCGGPLEFDGVERVYFSFLREVVPKR